MKEVTDSNRISDTIFIENQSCDVCIKKAEGIARCLYACTKHFSIFQRDNDFCHKNDIEITKDLNIFKPCFRNKCTQKLLVPFDDTGQDLFCSEDCEIIQTRGPKYFKTLKKIKEKEL